jgi:hypothetical protein
MIHGLFSTISHAASTSVAIRSRQPNDSPGAASHNTQ